MYQKKCCEEEHADLLLIGEEVNNIIEASKY